MSSLLNFLKAVVRFTQVWGKLLVVVVPAILAFIYSPFFRQFFLGVAVGALALFAIQYSNLFPSLNPSTDCFNPQIEAGGPVCKIWKPTDPNDPRDMYGHWENCP